MFGILILELQYLCPISGKPTLNLLFFKYKVLIVYLSSSRDMKNLIKFVYTGKAALNPQEFEVFQQMMGEFQIGMDENSAIILEEKESDDEGEIPTNTVSLVQNSSSNFKPSS